MPVTNNFEALVEALLLSVIAPTEAKSVKACKLAESFAASLSDDEVEEAKKLVQSRVLDLVREHI